MSVIWYPNYDWMLSVSATLPTIGRRYMGSGVWYRSRPSMDLNVTASYVTGNWNFELMLDNILNKDRRSNSYTETEYVDRHTYSVSKGGFSARLTVSYSFDYGKRVDRGNRYSSEAGSISNVRN